MYTFYTIGQFGSNFHVVFVVAGFGNTVEAALRDRRNGRLYLADDLQDLQAHKERKLDIVSFSPRRRTERQFCHTI